MASFIRLFFIVAGLFLAGFSSAELEADPIHVEPFTSHKTVKPGELFQVALHFHVEEGWHTYWKNPGEAGAPLKITWELPEGFTLVNEEWPSPQVFHEQGLTIYGYGEDFVLLATLKAPEKADSFALGIGARWIACKESCEPGQVHLDQTLIVGEETLLEEASSSIIQKAKALVPQKRNDLKVTGTGDGLQLSLATENKSIQFFPEEPGQLAFDLSEGAKIPAQMASNGVLKGVLKVGNEFFVVDQPVGEASSWFFLGTLLAAFAGGLILNLMPCVFPVLSLKVLSVIETAGDSRLQKLIQASLYGVGVLVSFWFISGLLLIIRASGHHIGWGFQLQEPLFVAFLAALFFVMGLNLFGLFEMGSGLASLQNKSPRQGLLAAFFSGVLATIVATPCTGPLLGSTLGYAMSLPVLQALMLFTAMALGLALPFVLLIMCPPLMRFLPKPGVWMVRLKEAMGFLMMASVLWLLWVFEAETNFPTTLWLLASLLVLAITAWIWGAWGNPMKAPVIRRLAVLVSATLVLGSGFFVVNRVEAARLLPPPGLIQAADEEWMAFTPELFEKLIAENKPVFVDFTAKWCLICQANKAVLYSDQIQEAFTQKGVVKLKADWTKGDPAITAYLKKFQRGGVPLYVYYKPDSSTPVVFSETLTPSAIIDAL